MTEALEIVRDYSYASVRTIKRFSQSRAFVRGLMGALAAETANCRLHGGFIPHDGDHEGKVFLCGAGRMYWRYEPLLGKYLGPLPYKWRP